MMWVFIVGLALVTPQVVFSVFTEKQVVAATKLLRDTCINKAKPDIALVDGLQKGNFVDDKKLQCYMYCVLATYKLMREDNSFDWETGIKVLRSNAPTRMSEPGSKSLENCKDAIKTQDDKCVAAYEIAKCVYADNPSTYFLP